MEVDDRDVRESLHEIVLETGPLGRAGGSLQRRDGGLRRLVEGARAEHEDEAAVPRFPPLDVANARHPGTDAAAENVEPHGVADVNA